MSSVKANILANVVGKIWVIGINIVLVPLYVKYLGIESYGLVGFYTTLLSSLMILDLGLGMTLNRELAKGRDDTSNAKTIRNLTFTLEVIYWAIGLFTAGMIALLAGPISTNWIEADALSPDTVRRAVLLMALVFAFQWPVSLYNGGLNGLERQVTNSIINVVMHTLRAAGVLLILQFYSATIEAFLLWQAGVCFVFVIVMRVAMWMGIPKHTERVSFSTGSVRLIWKFAAGMTGVGITTFLLSQVDKIILSKLLPLNFYGYYTLAFTVAGGISLVAIQISNAFFPKLAKAYGTNDVELRQIYHRASAIMASMIFPICLVLIFFTYDILLLWTKDPETAVNSYMLTRMLVIGSMCNALMILPYNLIVASGWVKFTFYQNLIGAIILVPMLIVWTNTYGAFGATFGWIAINAGYIVFSQPLMHRKLLKGELATWYVKDVIVPLLPSLAVIVSMRLILTYLLPSVNVGLVVIGFVFALAFFVSMFRYRNSLKLI